MELFAFFYRKLDSTNSVNEKTATLVDYFTRSNEADRLWTLALLSGRRPKRTVATKLLREWAAELSNIPDWLFEESYHTVGDLAETIALLVQKEKPLVNKDLFYWMNYLNDLQGKDEDYKKQQITEAWKCMDSSERFVFNKLITGGFRVGVAQKTVEKALAKLTGIPDAVVAHRLTGNWKVEEVTWESLLLNPSENEDLSKPYPFCLAYPLQGEPERLGEPGDWIAEWKWDGIRGQFILRGGEWFLWSRGEELITSQFPEFEKLAAALPDGTVLDGEILVIRNGQVETFQQLQKRIGRKKPGKKILEDCPAGFIAYDLLEYGGMDYRNEALITRRNKLMELKQLLHTLNVFLSDTLPFISWNELAEWRSKSRDHSAEGLMLKKADSTYQVGRKRGDWWKWKVDPMTIDAVMIYAMPGHGRRANLFTDYTFAVWEGEKLVPVAKAYSGLSDDEIREVDAFVKANTIEKFGPVRSVKAELVFELGFENIQISSRHKSGVALRFPRILRWRRDKIAKEADTLEGLKMLIN
jgi:DNA ligase-1